MIRRTLKEAYNKLISWRYSIGFAQYSDSAVMDPSFFPKIHWIKGVPRGRWFADPFILSMSENEIEVLVEDYSYKENKAHISIIKVDRVSFKFKNSSTLLELSSHLSFPAFFKQGRKLFIYPEQCRSGRLIVYEFDIDTHSLINQTVLLKQPIADAIIADVYGRTVITGTLYPNDNSNVLYIYPFDYYSVDESDSRPIEIVRFQDNTARNAGQYFYIGKQLFRPAQCTNTRYGECLVFQKISRTDSGDTSFEEVKRIYSPSSRYNLSFHTFNIYERKLVVVDASGYRFRIIGHCLESLRCLFLKRR